MSISEEVKKLQIPTRLDITSKDLLEIGGLEADCVMRACLAFKLGYKRGMEARKTGETIHE